MRTRGLQLENYTDATAPDYDGIRVILSSLIATTLAVMFVGLTWALEDFSPLEARVPQPSTLGLVELFGVGIAFLGVLIVARFIAVRALATGSLPYAIVGVLVSLPLLAAAAAVVLELVFGGVLPSYYWRVGGGFAILVFAGNLIVNGTDINMSKADRGAFLLLFIILPTLLIQGMVWDVSGDGIFWTLYLLIGDFIKYVLVGGAFLLYYMHDIYHVASAEHSLGLNSCAAYVSAVSVPLIPVDAIFQFALQDEDDNEDSENSN